jgi:hypothetical protein
LPRLLHHLSPFIPEVVEHSSQPPDPWAGYRKCLTGLPHCTHLLVIQDDAIPVPGFADVLPDIAAANPDRPVCLWMSAIPANAAMRARRVYGKQPYVPLGPAPFVPLVCVLWPVSLASQFARWAEAASRLTRADDGNAARWMRQTKTEFAVTVPSIVEHDDFTPTVKGGTRKESHGRARDRVALLLADDARNHEW